METELKLLLLPNSRAIVESHPLFAAAESRDEQQRTTYFDTPDHTLRRRGASLRIRASDSGCVQTVKKRCGPDASVAARDEWEWPLASEAPDPEAVMAERGTRDLLQGVADALAPVFVTDIRRTKRLLRIGGATDVEAVIDEGVVRAGDRREAIAELELELKGGPSAPLFRLAADLSSRASLRLGLHSKAERGYQLLTEEPAPNSDPGHPDLPRGVSLGAAFRARANAVLRALLAELPAAASGEVEGVHRLRTSVRRLRTLLVLFKPVLEPVAAQSFNRLLREFGAVLGEGRDWDVFVTETLPAAKRARAVDVDELLPEAERLRAEAHRNVVQIIEGPVPTDLVLRFGAWTADEPWRSGVDPSVSLAHVLPKLFHHLERKARKRAGHLGSARPDDLHGLRKAIKKLRYGAEDVGSLFKRKRVERYLKSCKATLSALGDINDAAVTQVRVADVAPDRRADLAEAADAVLAWNETRRTKARRKLRSRLREVFGEEPFWVR